MCCVTGRSWSRTWGVRTRVVVYLLILDMTDEQTEVSILVIHLFCEKSGFSKVKSPKIRKHELAQNKKSHENVVFVRIMVMVRFF